MHHLLTRDEWAKAEAAGEYRPKSLREEGFIHGAYPDQTVRIANTLDSLRGRDDLVCLVIETDRLRSPLRDDVVEFPPGVESTHPHIYGPLNVDAVVRVVPFPPGPDGLFSRPPD